MKRYSLLLIPLFILSLLFVSCQGIGPAPTPSPSSEGEGEETPEENTGRVVLVELFNAEGCPSCRLLNPIVEEVAEEYSTDEVILVELKGWLFGATDETIERFSMYVPEDKRTPYIAFNGLCDTFSGKVSGGGGGGGGGPVNHAPIVTSEPVTTATVDEEYVYDVEATDADDDTLTYSLATGPVAMFIEPTTGLITWTPTWYQTGEYDISVEVSDGRKKSTQNFIITVSDRLYAIAITNQITEPLILEKKIEYLKSEGIIKDSYSINKPLSVKRGSTEHYIEIGWPNSFPDASGYKIYRKENSSESEYELYYTLENPSSDDWLYFDDDSIETEGKSYTYYITAYNSNNGEPEEEIYRSNEMTINTWLPPCSLDSPVDEFPITEPIPSFAWNPVGLSDFPSGSIVSGDSDLWIYDYTSVSGAWWRYFDDMTTSNVTYNDDGSAASLVSGHEYYWNSWGYGYDGNGDLIAMSWSEDWDFTVDIEGSTVRRALLVGVGDYISEDIPDLPAPPYDVDMMRDTLEHSGIEPNLIGELKDQQATKSDILTGIANAFDGADSDDISYFYFTGHGTLDNDDVSYLCPTDYNLNTSTAISVNDLETALSAIQGTKVIFIDSCHSGGFIGREINQESMSDYLQDYNSNIINTFMAKSFTERDLATSQYQVLTACLSIQTSVELIPSEGNPFGLFSRVLCDGCGYDYYSHPYHADSNANGEVTLDEAYYYTDQEVSSAIEFLNTEYSWNLDQDTQVYPKNSYFVIIEESTD